MTESTTGRQFAHRPFALSDVRLLPSEFRRRFDLNRRYLMKLTDENLLQSHYLEAGLWATHGKPEHCHWGWESPTCQLRGHFLGHWISGAARTFAAAEDYELKARVDHVVAELGRCQRENGGEWVGSIPANYLDWLLRKKTVWAPQYTLHKTLMGLFDAYRFAGSDQAIDIMSRWADWFHRWTGQLTREQLDDVLDVETGGMLEAWADLYGVTGRSEHLDLIQRYDRPRLFDRLLAGEDALTNKHANTTIPEAQGAARAWEVTGETRWRNVAEAYWKCAVKSRGYYATGGQTSGEIWSPPGVLAARLGDKNQEHCTVYNMMRLAGYLQSWTGNPDYADYWERNLYNGVLAQQNPDTGQIAYFLPLAAGARKVWGSETEHFWCCHGTLVQANASHGAGIYFESHDELAESTTPDLAVCQYIPSELTWRRSVGGSTQVVRVTQQYDRQIGQTHRPRSLAVDLTIDCAEPAEFTLQLRLPWWIASRPRVTVNGHEESVDLLPSSFHDIRRTWHAGDKVRIELPRRLTASSLPDEPGTLAFLDGPVVLAGLCDEERTLVGDRNDPATLLVADNEREWESWQPGYRTRGQARGIRFVPLSEIRDERYTVYFPVVAAGAGSGRVGG